MTLAKRQAFTLIKKAYEKINRKPVTTPSTLRLIVPLTANRTSFTFPILEGDSNLSHPNQILLNRADSFTATSFGLFVGGLSIATAMSGAQSLQAITLANSNLLGNELLSQDAVLLSQTQLGTQLNAFSLLNNSNLDIAVNNVKYLQNFDVFGANKSTNLTLNNTAGNSNEIDYSGITTGNRGEVDGFVDLVPTIQLSGTSKIDITLNCPSAPLSSAVDTLYLEIIFRGFLSLGASNLNK
jgi:hypothetical protein